MARKLTGIRRKRGKWQAFIRVHSTLHTKTFELATSLETMRAWRDEQKRRYGTVVAAPGGSFADDIVKYVARHATMPTLAQRAVHLELWARELGRDRTSESITGDEIIAVMNRWARTPTVVGKGRRGRPSATEGLSPATRRKRRTALQSFFAAMNGPGGYNPVKQVPIPESPKPEARHLDFGTIARIVAQMPGERSVKPGAPRVISLAGIRVQVLAHTGIPPGLLQKIGPSDLVLVGAGAVRVRARLKGAGIEARTIPLTAAGLAAFKTFHAANAYGRFAIAALNRSFKRACKRAGVDPSTVTLYDLRHSFLTQLYKTTRDLATVGRFGLHAEGSRVTARYAQGANRDVDIAAAAAMSVDLAQVQRDALKPVGVQKPYTKLPRNVARSSKSA